MKSDMFNSLIHFEQEVIIGDAADEGRMHVQWKFQWTLSLWPSNRQI